MPRTTHAYPFEARIGAFACDLVGRFTTGAAPRAFLLVLDQEGSVVSLTFEGGAPDWEAKVRSVDASDVPHLLYDPLDDGKEYVWLSWRGIIRPVMERLIGARFEEADFLPIPAFALRAQPLERGEQFPSSWGVMF